MGTAVVLFCELDPSSGLTVDGVISEIDPGNSGDSVARRSYELGSVKIYGYGCQLFDK